MKFLKLNYEILKLKRIRWRNIGPYGNKLQELVLDEKGGLWLIQGKNGNGKSFIVNLPKILYYGKLDKFKKEDIANRLNRHGWVWGETEINPNTYVTIERKLAPSDLTVFKHGPDEYPGDANDIGKSGISNYQDYIDVEVTELPYHIFANIISLSVNDFKSFISMTPHDKRVIIDKLFAMEVINRMNDMIKKDLRQLSMNIALIDTEINSLKKTVKNAQKELEKLKQKVDEDNTKRVENLITSLKDYQQKYANGKSKLKQFQEKEKDIQTKFDNYQKQKSELQTSVRSITKKLTLFKQDKCPTCETPFSDKIFELIRGELDEHMQKKTIELETLAKSEHHYKDALKKIKEGLKQINDFLVQIRTNYNAINNELKKIKDLKPHEFESISNIISKHTITVKEKEESKINIDDDHKYLKILEELYSDAGVKKKILESYLPTLNKEIEYTLSELHFPYQLRFNNDFEPHLQHLGFDVNVETLSTGEKKRVDLAVLISIIRMLKRKYHNLNIFMLDEVLSSIDGDGIYDIIGLLRKTAKELAINIFIINHSTLPIEYFDYKIDVTKKDGFSDLTIEKLESEDIDI